MVIRGRPIVWSILGRVTLRHLLTPIARLWVALEARLRLSVRRGHVRLLVDIHFQFSSCLNLKTRKEHRVRINLLDIKDLKRKKKKKKTNIKSFSPCKKDKEQFHNRREDFLRRLYSNMELTHTKVASEKNCRLCVHS